MYRCRLCLMRPLERAPSFRPNHLTDGGLIELWEAQEESVAGQSYHLAQSLSFDHIRNRNLRYVPPVALALGGHLGES